MYTCWFNLYQRPHHFVKAMLNLGHYVSLFAPRSLRSRDARFGDHERLSLSTSFFLSQRLSRLPLVRRLNDERLTELLRRFVEDKADVHVFANAPENLPKNPRPSRLIYDCMDHWAGFPGARHDISTTENALCNKADKIWVSSRALERRLTPEFEEKLVYIPNGVDYDHFSAVPGLRNAATRKCRRPVLGYIGWITDWFDEVLVAELARRLDGWQLHLVGPRGLTREGRARLNLPNVHFFGPQPYSALPNLMADFDVAMIPFRITDLTLATNPVKLYEYLAAGLPVVSTLMPEVVRFEKRGAVECYETARELAIACDRLATTREPGRCQAIAQQHSWTSRFEHALAS